MSDIFYTIFLDISNKHCDPSWNNHAWALLCWSSHANQDTSTWPHVKTHPHSFFLVIEIYSQGEELTTLHKLVHNLKKRSNSQNFWEMESLLSKHIHPQEIWKMWAAQLFVDVDIYANVTNFRPYTISCE